MRPPRGPQRHPPWPPAGPRGSPVSTRGPPRAPTGPGGGGEKRRNQFAFLFKRICSLFSAAPPQQPQCSLRAPPRPAMHHLNPTSQCSRCDPPPSTTPGQRPPVQPQSTASPRNASLESNIAMQPLRPASQYDPGATPSSAASEHRLAPQCIT